jgi:hypothetical protein
MPIVAVKYLQKQCVELTREWLSTTSFGKKIGLISMSRTRRAARNSDK